MIGDDDDIVNDYAQDDIDSDDGVGLNDNGDPRNPPVETPRDDLQQIPDKGPDFPGDPPIESGINIPIDLP